MERPIFHVLTTEGRARHLRLIEHSVLLKGYAATVGLFPLFVTISLVMLLAGRDDGGLAELDVVLTVSGWGAFLVGLLLAKPIAQWRVTARLWLRGEAFRHIFESTHLVDCEAALSAAIETAPQDQLPTRGHERSTDGSVRIARTERGEHIEVTL